MLSFFFFNTYLTITSLSQPSCLLLTDLSSYHYIAICLLQSISLSLALSLTLSLSVSLSVFLCITLVCLLRPISNIYMSLLRQSSERDETIHADNHLANKLNIPCKITYTLRYTREGIHWTSGNTHCSSPTAPRLPNTAAHASPTADRYQSYIDIYDFCIEAMSHFSYLSL